ncbi:two-component system, OmpR family, KDP operon response regulator KdpE [Loktanella fryxellensis]|uniref:Two-component system, OmpR family, KDP operon response regulator KdpE n=1 Tax=Loktanella fryxellensis TaxID=245187 RepID=A0A1H8J9S1_9RHOB|nr:response regulator transcription factor [Loktanella fryxellensis]SEN77540.1 two-component system, OmpR family, KDP operon response regulator KdpE [Loktanella fryxellensis]
MTGHILIVDDDMGFCRLRRAATLRGGFAAKEADSASAAMAALDRAAPDLVLLDLGLPDRDGLELNGAFRAQGVPIMVLTARKASAEKIAAPDLGADDDVTKPFDSEELLARTRSCLRRADLRQGIVRRLTVGTLRIDLDARTVHRQGVEVRLTPAKFDLRVAPVRHQGKVLTHTHLLREVWGPAHVDHVENLRVAVRALRKKLEGDPAASTLIRNEPGVGYYVVEG